MTFTVCLFELVHLNGLLFDEWVDHVVKELIIEKALKTTIFVVQKAAAPKNGVEFCQKSIGVIRCSLATSCNDVRCCVTLPKLFCHDHTNRQTNKATYKGGAHISIIGFMY